MTLADRLEEFHSEVSIIYYKCGMKWDPLAGVSALAKSRQGDVQPKNVTMIT